MAMDRTILLGLLQRAYEQQMAYASSLTAAERAATGAPDRWSAKDVFAHNAEWVAITARSFASAKRQDIPPSYSSTDARNGEIYEHYRTYSWDEILALLQVSYRQMIGEINVSSDAELQELQHVGWLADRTAWSRIAHTAFFHPLHHIAQMHLARGERDAADQLEATTENAMLALDDSPRWQGTYNYNWGCYFVAAGDKQKAIEHLRRGFLLRPELRELSSQDSELDAIRDDPQFKELLA